MDSLAFRLANALVGNDEGAAGLEITLSGFSQHTKHTAYNTAFHSDLCLNTALIIIDRAIGIKGCISITQVRSSMQK